MSEVQWHSSDGLNVKPKNFKIKILLYFPTNSKFFTETVLSDVFKPVKTYLQIAIIFYILFLIITYMSAPVKKTKQIK